MWPTVPPDCSSQQNKMMASTRRDYPVFTCRHSACVSSSFCLLVYTSCTTSACRSTAKWCSLLLCIRFVNQYTDIEWCPFSMKTIVLHPICCGHKAAAASCWLNSCVNKCQHYCRHLFIFKKQNIVLVDAKPSAHTHCFCVRHTLLEMIRELKNVYPSVCPGCSISSSCFSTLLCFRLLAD